MFFEMLRSGWGCAVLIILATLVACCAMGIVDFARKAKPLAPESADDDLADTQEKVRRFLTTEINGLFEVSHFDGAFQVFTTSDQPISNEELYKALQKKFPRRVFSFHRTLHAGNDAAVS